MTAPNPWDRYAAIEPLFAVLSSPKYLRANLTREAEEEFFATGEAWARHVLRRLAPYGIGDAVTACQPSPAAR